MIFKELLTRIMILTSMIELEPLNFYKDAGVDTNFIETIGIILHNFQ